MRTIIVPSSSNAMQVSLSSQDYVVTLQASMNVGLEKLKFQLPASGLYSVLSVKVWIHW